MSQAHNWKTSTFIPSRPCASCQGEQVRARYKCKECHVAICKNCRKTNAYKKPCTPENGESKRDKRASSLFRRKARARSQISTNNSSKKNNGESSAPTLAKSPSSTTPSRRTTVLHQSSDDLRREAESARLASTGSISESIGELVETEVYEWGGRRSEKLSIRKLLPRTRVLSIASSGAHAAVLTRERQVFIWGDGRSGQLGCGREVRELDQPKLLEFLSDKNIASVACGPLTTAAISTTGLLFMWGYRFDEQAPVHEPAPYSEFPIESDDHLPLVQGDDYQVLQICFSAHQGAALIDEGVDGESDIRLWTWGQGKLLGHGAGVTSCPSPRRVEALRDHNVVQVDCGEHHMAVLTDQGRLYMWGSNIHQEIPDKSLLGVTTATALEPIIHQPQLIAGLERNNLVYVSCGSWHTVALDDKGKVYSWGYGRRGYLGHGDEVSRSEPKLIEGLADKNVVGVECGGQHTVAWTDTGEIYSWGRRGDYKLGHEVDEDVSTPKLVQAVCRAGQENKIVYGISANFSSTLAFLGIDRARLVFGNDEATVAAREFPTVGDLLRFAAKNWNVDESDLMLLNCTGQSLSRSQNVRTLIFEEELDPTFMVRSRAALWATKRKGINFEKLDGRMEVSSGRLEELVKWLTYHEFTGTQFKAAFLLTFRTMGLEPERLLDMLIARYLMPFADKRSNPDKGSSSAALLKEKIAKIEKEQHKKCVRARVLDVIGKWITTYPADFINGKVSSSQIIEKLLQFLESEPIQAFESKAKRIRRSVLFELGHMQTRADASLPTTSDYPEPVPLHGNPMDFWKYSAVDMARQITCMDFYKFFRHLNEHEFLDCAWMKEDKEDRAPNILRLIRRFNNGAEWVAAEVLQGETPELRVARAEKLIDVGDELLKLHNYSSMMMVVSGFMSTPVYRLKSLWENISSKHFKKLQNMRTILDASGNHTAYRKHFASVPSPKLPFLGLYLTDLVYLQEDPEFVTDVDSGEKFINFRKRLKIAQIILGFKSLQLIPYVIKPHPELWNYLWMVRGFQNHEKTAYQLSKSIEGAGATDDNVVLPSPVLSETVVEQYNTVTKAAPVAEDAQVTLLNGQARVACLRRKDRRRVWKQWLQLLDEHQGSRLGKASLGKSAEDAAVSSSRDALLGGGASFRTLFCLSVALEYSVKSALLAWPSKRVTAVDQEDSDYQLLRKLLLTVKCSVVNEKSVDSLLDALGELSKVRVSDEAFEPVFSLITVWKSTCIMEEALKAREKEQVDLLNSLDSISAGTSNAERAKNMELLDHRYSSAQEKLEAWSKYESVGNKMASLLENSSVAVFDKLRMTLVRTEAQRTHSRYIKSYRTLLARQKQLELALQAIEEEKLKLEQYTTLLNNDLIKVKVAPLLPLVAAVEEQSSPRSNLLFQMNTEGSWPALHRRVKEATSASGDGYEHSSPEFPLLSKFLQDFHEPVMACASALVKRSDQSSEFLRQNYPRLLMKHRLKLQVEQFKQIKEALESAPEGEEKDRLCAELQEFNHSCATLRHAIFDLESGNKSDDEAPLSARLERSRSNTLAGVVSQLVETGQEMASKMIPSGGRRALPRAPPTSSLPPPIAPRPSAAGGSAN